MRRMLTLLALFTLTGCGAIFNGTRQNIPVQSSPPGAAVVAGDGGHYTTPTNLSLERKHSYNLTFNLPGYAPGSFTVNNKLQGGILVLDVLLTGLIGVVVDAATGAWYSLSPDNATVALTRTTALGPDTVNVDIGQTAHAVTVSSDVPGVEVTVTRLR